MPDLVIGLLFPTSSPSRDTSLQCIEAARVAVDRFTPDGWKIRLIEGDAASPAIAATEAERLIRQERAGVIVGTLRSELSLPATAAASKLGAVYWEAIASDDEVTTRRLPRVFRLDGRATSFAAAGVDFAADVLAPTWGMRPDEVRVSSAVEGTSFPESFGKATEKLAAARGLVTVGTVALPTEGENYREQLDPIRAARPHVLFSAGFHPMVAKLWRELVARPLGLKAVIGISNWAFPRDPELARTGYERAFAIGAPYLFTAKREGLGTAAQSLLESWWASSKTPMAQTVAVDRDIVFSAVWTLLRHVLPHARDASPDAIADAARAVDVPMWSSPVGYGAQFDALGNNERIYALIMQWQRGKRLVVHPRQLATAEIDFSTPDV